MVIQSTQTSAGATSIGELSLAPPLSGTWSLPDFPEQVIVEGRSFRRASWRQSYKGVVEQYREERAQESMHLMVYSDGRWVVDHVDDDNPDRGRAISHFFNDHPAGKMIKSAAPIVGLGVGLGVALYLASRYLSRS